MRFTGMMCWFLAASAIGAADCPPPKYDGSEGPPSLDYLIETDAYSLEIGSSSGAAGDVVGVPVVLRSRLADPGWPWMCLTICHDPLVAEIAGDPIYTGEFLALLGVGGAMFWPVHEGIDGPCDNHRGHGFVLDIVFDHTAYAARFPSDVPLTIMTVYYRLIGPPGASAAVSFCDFTLSWCNRPCNYTMIHGSPSDRPGGYDYLAKVKAGGTLTVVDGPAAHPDPPPEPPAAMVYPDRPDDAAVNFRVRVGGAAARPGDEGVPVPVFVAADMEYTGILVPLEFDPQYLRLARAEQSFVGGVITTQYPGLAAGQVVLFSGLGYSNRRLAAEGEEILAATLYFDVLPAAAEIAETGIRVAASPRPWIGVRYRDGTGTGAVIRAAVAPIRIASGAFILDPASLVLRGDANDDGGFDLSDPIAVLAFLYLADAAPGCPAAADFNRDGDLDISDPIAMLGALFLGTSPADGRDLPEVPCR